MEITDWMIRGHLETPNKKRLPKTKVVTGTVVFGSHKSSPVMRFKLHAGQRAKAKRDLCFYYNGVLEFKSFSKAQTYPSLVKRVAQVLEARSYQTKGEDLDERD